MTYLLGLSGPPRVGKDTLGQALGAQLTARGVPHTIIALSMPMRLTIYAMLGMTYDLTHYEEHKDEPQEQLCGNTIRQAMIALSEDHVKPRYGQGFWGQSGINGAMRSKPQVIIVTDMGFDAEVNVATDRFGAHNCMWVQMTRAGCDFSRDSRGYVGDPDRVALFDNPGEGLEVFIGGAKRLLSIAEQRGWKLTNDSSPPYTSLDVDGG